MANEIQIRSWPLPLEETWPPDDTEESILGTDWHQMTITNLRLGINEAAELRAQPGQPAPWTALSQGALLGCVRPDGSTYRTYPDVFVYRGPVDASRGSLSLVQDGAPALILEVLSDSTYRVDLDVVGGKGYSYARAGVREYLAVDPTGRFLSTGISAWRLEDGQYRLWKPDADGRWHSAELPLAFDVEDTLAAVYTSEGRRMLREREIEVAFEQERQLRVQSQEAFERERQLRIQSQETSERERQLRIQSQETSERERQLRKQIQAENERLRRLLEDFQQK